MLGIGFAAPAFAVDGATMKVNSTDKGRTFYAIVNSITSGTYVLLANSGSAWNVPTSSGQISVFSGRNHCMSVDPSNNRIELETCTGSVDEEWDAHAQGGGYWFFNAASNDCLNAHWQATPTQVNVAPCNQGANQIWILTT
jgi:hypothetical protein